MGQPTNFPDGFTVIKPGANASTFSVDQSGNLYVGGKTAQSGNVTGAQTFAGTVTIAGAATLQSTLAVTGATTLSGTLSFGTLVSSTVNLVAAVSGYIEITDSTGALRRVAVLT